MPVMNYSTTVPAERTVAEIQRRLSQHGAQRIAIDYENGRPRAVQFVLSHPEWGPKVYNLPIDAEAMQRVLLKQTKVSRNSKQGSIEQAERVAWRVLKDWIAAQLAIAETQMVSLPEIMLPYLVVDMRTGQTLRESTQVKEIGRSSGQ